MHILMLYEVKVLHWSKMAEESEFEASRVRELVRRIERCDVDGENVSQWMYVSSNSTRCPTVLLDDAVLQLCVVASGERVVISAFRTGEMRKCIVSTKKDSVTVKFVCGQRRETLHIIFFPGDDPGVFRRIFMADINASACVPRERIPACEKQPKQIIKQGGISRSERKRAEQKKMTARDFLQALARVPKSLPKSLPMTRRLFIDLILRKK